MGEALRSYLGALEFQGRLLFKSRCTFSKGQRKSLGFMASPSADSNIRQCDEVTGSLGRARRKARRTGEGKLEGQEGRVGKSRMKAKRKARSWRDPR